MKISSMKSRCIDGGFALLLITAACSSALGAEETNTPPAAPTNSIPAVAVAEAAAPIPAPSTDNAKEMASSGSTNAPARNSYEAFKLIPDRNIFNPGRSARSAGGDRRDGEPKKVVKTEMVSLVGVMSYAKGDIAFFDGSSSEYRKAIRSSEKLGGHRLVEVGANYVQLATDGKTNRVAIGGGLRRQDEGEWEVVASGIKLTPEASSAPAAAVEGDASAGGGESDILKRLMQKREQELNNEKK